MRDKPIPPNEALQNAGRFGQMASYVVNRTPDFNFAKALIATNVSSLLLHISNENWERILEASKEPCMDLECLNCQEYTAPMFDALDTFRTTIQKILIKRGGVKLPDPA